jgi:hypothetical protein
MAWSGESSTTPPRSKITARNALDTIPEGSRPPAGFPSTPAARLPIQPP